MQKLSASNLVGFIDKLDKNSYYEYINSRNKGLIKIVGITPPEGPIKIKRWIPTKGETEKGAKEESISTEMLWRIANALSEAQPISIERILAASYNTRSVLEALLAYTPMFYYSYPGRIENLGGKSQIKQGHKHLIWLPNKPHRQGIKLEHKTDVVISEVPQQDAYYEALAMPTNDLNESAPLDIAVRRRHAQIQIALYHIGKQLNFRTWIAQNDKGIIYNNKRIGEFDGIIDRLQDEKLLSAYDEAVRAALLIDCIWFKNGKLMPAVMEVEHSTGVTSGLTRMKNFKDNFVSLEGVRYVVVAADEDRDKVIREANKPQFLDLKTKFFPYSAVEELYSLCQKRKIRGVTEEFLDCYMEPVISPRE